MDILAPVDILGQQYAVHYIDVARFIIACVFFGYAGYSDLRKRRIKKWVWYPPLVSGGILLALDLYLMPSSEAKMTALAANFLLVTVIILSVWLIPIPTTKSRLIDRLTFKTRGLMALGDLKAFAVLGVLIPLTPILGPFPLFQPSQVLFPASAILASAIVAVGYLLYNIIANVAYTKSMPTLDALMGYRTMKTEDAMNSPLKGRVVETDGLELQEPIYLPKIEKDALSSQEKHSLYTSSEVKVYLGLPQVFLLFCGILLAGFVGDIMFLFL